MNINLTNYKISTNDIFRKTLLKLGMIHRRAGANTIISMHFVFQNFISPIYVYQGLG